MTGLNLEEKYKKEIVPVFLKGGKYANAMRVPRLVKVVINRGAGEARENPKAIEASAQELANITGQKPSVRTTHKSIAAFKIRSGMAVGLKVTLRGKKMYDFMTKLVNISLPKIRDFRGVSPKSFDGRGNYTLGIKEQLIFPEVDFESVDRVRGMDITIVTSAESDAEAKELLEAFGMPFRKES